MCFFYVFFCLKNPEKFWRKILNFKHLTDLRLFSSLKFVFALPRLPCNEAAIACFEPHRYMMGTPHNAKRPPRT